MTVTQQKIRLTTKQKEYVALCASGKDYKMIAALKCVSPTTVRNVIHAAKRNNNADNIAHLCSLAQHSGQIISDGANGFRPSVDPFVTD